jgi:hypothetical protein
MEQMQNEMKRLLRQEKEEDRRARTHRICKRGGLIESLLPDTIMLSDERFKAFLEKTTANKFGREALATLKAEQEKDDTNNGADAVEVREAPALKSAVLPLNNFEPTPPKPASPPQDGGAASAAKPAEALRPGA